MIVLHGAQCLIIVPLFYVVIFYFWIEEKYILTFDTKSQNVLKNYNG
jgi:hypothetical protein